MRLPKACFFISLILSCHVFQAQDSLPRLGLKLFDIGQAISLNCKESANLNLAYARSFAGEDHPYFKPEVTGGYSDGVRNTHGLRSHMRKADRPPRESYGSVYAQYGLSASFKFLDGRHRFIELLKPRIGLYHGSRRFFSHNVGKDEIYSGDTLHFTDPQFPPLVLPDSGVFRNINYSYTSKLLYFELGCNVDFYRTRFFLFYTGFLYSYGLGYKNEFYMRKDEYIFYTDKPFRVTESRHREPPGHSSRFTVPMGILIRFSRNRHFAPGFYAECSPGYETYTIKGGRSLSHLICTFTWGLRFNFQPHKNS